jgi:hypothetical protein
LNIDKIVPQQSIKFCGFSDFYPLGILAFISHLHWCPHIPPGDNTLTAATPSNMAKQEAFEAILP